MGRVTRTMRAMMSEADIRWRAKVWCPAIVAGLNCLRLGRCYSQRIGWAVQASKFGFTKLGYQPLGFCRCRGRCVKGGSNPANSQDQLIQCCVLLYTKPVIPMDQSANRWRLRYFYGLNDIAIQLPRTRPRSAIKPSQFRTPSDRVWKRPPHRGAISHGIYTYWLQTFLSFFIEVI